MLGSPVGHSLSPQLHEAAYRELGLTDWTYRRVECTAAGLAATLHELDAQGLAGASLTMPLKQAVLPMLARVDRLAADVGGANTVLFGGESGRWWGTTTDVGGMVAALRAAGVSLRRSDEPVVLGAGATAAAAVAALAELGARAVRVRARRPEAVAAVADVAARFGLATSAPTWDDPAGLDGSALVVSCLPGRAADRFAAEVRRPRGALFDVVYDPWPTRLAQAWQTGGGVVLGGLDLLVAQAVEQVRLMTGRSPDPATMRAAGERALAARSGATDPIG